MRPKQHAKYLRRKAHLARYKIKTGCIECGYNKDSRALQWAHIEPVLESRKKPRYGINSRIQSNSLKRLFEELRKCKVLCANCHAIETHKDGLLGGRKGTTNPHRKVI